MCIRDSNTCAGDKGHQTSLDELLFCSGACQRRWPEYCFDEKSLTFWHMHDRLSEAKCARCMVKDQENTQEIKFLCQRCGRATALADFGFIALKEWLALGRRKGAHAWVCFDCQFPRCVLCTHENRPLHAIPHNALIEGKYYCMEHRYPPCRECGAPRPNPSTKTRFKAFTCS